MPQVASQARAHGINYVRATAPRPAQASERAPGASFERLLDDNAADAAEQTEAPPTQVRSERADRAPAAGKRAGKPTEKGTEANTDKTAGKTVEADAPAKATANTPAETKDKQDISVSESKSEPVVKATSMVEPQPIVSIEFDAALDAAAGEAGDIAVAATHQIVASEPGTATPNGEPLAEAETTDGEKPDAAETVAAPTADAPTGATPADAGPPVAALVSGAETQRAAPAGQSAEAVAADAPKAGAVMPAAMPRADAGKAVAKLDGKTAEKIADKPAAAPTATDEPIAPAPAAPEAARKADAQARGETAATVQRAAAVPDAPAAPPADAAAAPKSDAAPAMTIVLPAHQTASAGNAAPPTPQAAAVPLSGVAIEIAGKAIAGKNRFEIRLDPPELGRIEVRMDVDRDGRVTSHLIADRRDTLDLLQRDSSSLQRALQDAGLKTSDNGLQFSLRDQSGNRQSEQSGPDGARFVVADDMPAPLEAAQAAQSRFAARRGGIDIRI